MLNSRYAPVIALGVLGAVVVLLLGWFLAVNPQKSKAAELDRLTSDVETNTQQVALQSAKIDEYAGILAADESVASSIALNAPGSPDLHAFRTRVWAAVVSSKVEIVAFDMLGSQAVDGWITEPKSLVSTQVATLFQTGPVTVAEAGSTPAPSASPAAGGTTTTVPGGWAPAVTAATTEGAVAGNIQMLPFTITVSGTAKETYDFLKALSNPEETLFQVFGIKQEARQSDSAPITGISDAADGDVQSFVSGALYVLNPTGAPADQGELVDVTPGNDGFIEPGEAPAQPGA